MSASGQKRTSGINSTMSANAQAFHGFCRSEVRMSASRSTAGSVNSGYRGRNTASVVMRAALGVDCNEPSAVGTARNWWPADASKPAARTAVKSGAASRTQTGKTQNECSAAASPGHCTTDANRLANRRPSRARRSSRSVRNVRSLRASRRSIAVGARCRSCAISSSPGKLRTALLITRSGSRPSSFKIAINTRQAMRPDIDFSTA